jgi:hypothetical protein
LTVRVDACLQTLGSQFCAITGLTAARGAPQPPTVAICNSIEQSEVRKFTATMLASFVAHAACGSLASRVLYHMFIVFC